MYSSQWLEWEREGAQSLQAQSIKPEQYPLTFFVVRLLVVRLLKLGADGMPPLNLHGHSQQVFSLFETTSERLLADSPLEGDLPAEGSQYSCL